MRRAAALTADPAARMLTRELLDQAVDALTAVLATPEIGYWSRAESSARDCLKQLDHLYPVVLRKDNE
jgi:hypothetical protein